MKSPIRRFLVFATGCLALSVFVGGVVPTFRKLSSRFSAENDKARLVSQIVRDTRAMLPAVTDNGIVRLDAIEDAGGALLWRSTLLTYTAADIDPATMRETLKKRALHRINGGENLSRVVLMGIPLKYVYSDSLGQPCVTFDVSRDDLALFRREMLESSAPNKPAAP
jgi:hypothetical protein